jgi:hypothetical protein
MKKTLFAVLIAFACALSAKSQTKGTNAIGLGGGISSQETTKVPDDGSYKNDNKSWNVSLNYGYFLKDNLEFEPNVFVGGSKSSSTFSGMGPVETDGKAWGAGLRVNKYYPLFKRLYLNGGVGVGYALNKFDRLKHEDYFLNANGGLSLFVGKHLRFRTILFSANASYAKTANKNSSEGTESKSKSFNFSNTSKIADQTISLALLF